MQHQAMFSVGDYELQSAEFAKRPKKRYVATPEVPQTAQQAQRLPKGINQARQNFINQPTGVRKGHIRNIGGKAVMVGQSILKAGKNTAGALTAGGLRVGGQAVGAGVSYAGRGAELIANNPRTSAIATGAGVLGAGAGYLATRKKRKRR